MGNFIALLVIVGLFSLLLIGIKETHKENKVNATMVNSGHYNVDYLGGSPHIEKTSSGYVKPGENSLIYSPASGVVILTKWGNIKSIETKTHEQITHDVTAGRLLLLGVFALAAKKQTIHSKQYLLIHCEEDGVNYDMVFTGHDMGALASRINRALIDYRRNRSAAQRLATN